jgi:hypothetical protein
MKFLKLDALSKQPRLKADDSATLTFSTMYELSQEDFTMLNDWSYEKEEVKVIAVKEDDYIDFILSEAKKLTTNITV